MLKNFINKRNLTKYSALVSEINKTFIELEQQELNIAEELQNVKSSDLNNRKKTIKAMALAKLAAKYTLGMSYYDVQLMGALAMVDGAMAEMKTGEGKTLTCSAAVAANYVLGYRTHVATANEYLAKRDEDTLHKLYHSLGITSSYNIPSMLHEEKHKAYLCDVVYSTAQEFGFDFLRDNLIYNPNEKLQPKDFSLVKAIIDEADFILIDEARTPLIISGDAPLKEKEFYYKIKNITESFIRIPITSNDNQQDIEGKQQLGEFWVDEKQRSVYLSEKGYHKLEEELERSGLLSDAYTTDSHISLYDSHNSWIINEAINALKARYLYIKDKDYVIQNNSIVIIDANTGRLSNGRTWSEGLHQAIEAKENLEINPENMTKGSISIQNYFRNYYQISGMSGTIMQSTEEFEQIYHCKTIQIPTNKPTMRKEHEDKIYVSAEYKYKAMLEDIKQRHQSQQPILIGTTSVAESEIISRLLNKNKLAHYVLNAKNHALEAQIIAQAGEPGRITVSTSMAGRGTDIILGGNKETIHELLVAQLDAVHNRIDFAHEFTKTLNLSQDIEVKIEPVKFFEINVYNNQLKINNLFDEAQFIDNLRYNIPYIWNFLYQLVASIEQQLDVLHSHWTERRNIVLEAGGLCVIGSSRNESRRIDNQLKGRAGRQGDPGECVFYMSLEDNWVNVFGRNPMLAHLLKNLPPEEPISTPTITKVFYKAQQNIESFHFDIRKNTYQYDSITDEGRRKFISLRNDLLFNKEVMQEMLHSKLVHDLSILLSSDFLSYIEDKYNKDVSLEQILDYPIDQQYALIEEYMNTDSYLYHRHDKKISTDILDEKIKMYFENVNENLWNELSSYLLETLDHHWVYHLNFIDEAQKNVGFSSLAQKNPVYEYKKICFQSFSNMLDNFKEKMVEKFITTIGKSEI